MTSAAVTPVFSDLVAACRAQQRFLQQQCQDLDAISYSARCRQLSELGGDCYDMVPVSCGRVALAIADASGKGLAGALMIASVQPALRTAARITRDDTVKSRWL